MLIATVSLPTDAVALEETLEELPTIEIEAEQIAAHSTEWTMPCLWISATDFEALDAALAADPTVKSVIETDEFVEEKYYHLEWADAVEERINAYTNKEGSILDAEATGKEWELQFRFASREQFDAFRETVAENGHTFELLDLAEPGSPRISTSGLTPTQRDALVAAYERGYYDIPREITARELAEDLDMSHQALSELLRRGTGQLIDASLTTAVDTDDH